MEHPLQETILRSLLVFFERYGSEVLGHTSAPPDAATLASIDRFVAGEMDEAEWNEFFAQVANRPKCMAIIAEKLQSLAA